ncbi:unnamed protein product [Echinostoma caproni]|uniref:Retrotransposon gag domain-containing protein n=1 Tax=Echinostoma caproni TaxID=27848 RepID=A0A183AU42_9TREM|nr:unnamed protein product [Echinostoma caproni]
MGEPSISREEKFGTNSVLPQTLSALRLVTENVAAQSIPGPPKFHISDHYNRWESQVRPYLLDEAVYNQIHQEVHEDVSGEAFDTMRSIIFPHRRNEQDQYAFHCCTQRPDETAQRFAAELLELSALAFPEFRRWRESGSCSELVRQTPPESLKEAIDRAVLLEEPPVVTDALRKLNAPANSPSDLRQRPRQYAGRRNQPPDRQRRPWVARENTKYPSSITDPAPASRSSQATEAELLLFSNASETGYEAVAYADFM